MLDRWRLLALACRELPVCRLAEVALERCRSRVERRTRCVDVEELWIGVLLGPSYLDLLPGDEVRDVRHGVFEVPNKNRLRRADRYAGGLESSVDPIRTEITLLSAVRHRIDVDGVVWTRRHTRLAADTARAVEVHYAVGALEHGRRGAYLHARRVGALVAAGDLEVPANVRVSPDLDLLDVRAIDAQRNVVFLFAGDGAGMTADALAVVDYLAPGDRLPAALFSPNGSSVHIPEVRVRGSLSRALDLLKAARCSTGARRSEHSSTPACTLEASYRSRASSHSPPRVLYLSLILVEYCEGTDRVRDIQRRSAFVALIEYPAPGDSTAQRPLHAPRRDAAAPDVELCGLAREDRLRRDRRQRLPRTAEALRRHDRGLARHR